MKKNLVCCRRKGAWLTKNDDFACTDIVGFIVTYYYSSESQFASSYLVSSRYV